MTSKVYEEMDALLTEALFSHRIVLLEGYHEIGKMVLENNLPISQVAFRLRQRPKTIHYCVELYKAYPNLDDLPMGKGVSWYKIMKILPPYEKKKNQE